MFLNASLVQPDYDKIFKQPATPVLFKIFMATQVRYSTPSEFSPRSFFPIGYDSELAKLPHTSPAGPEITFTDANGKQISIKAVNGSYVYFGSNSTHPHDGSEQGDFAAFPSIDAIVKKEMREFESLHRILWKRRAIREYGMEGHHFGGYHPGKNKRQSLGLSHLDKSLQDPFGAAERFGLPMLSLYVASRLLIEGPSNGHERLHSVFIKR